MNRNLYPFTVFEFSFTGQADASQLDLSETCTHTLESREQLDRYCAETFEPDQAAIVAPALEAGTIVRLNRDFLVVPSSGSLLELRVIDSTHN